MSEVILTDTREYEDKIIIQHAQDVSTVLNSNIETRKHTDEIWNGNHTIKPAATLDMVIFLHLQKHGIMQDKDLFFQWLERNPEYKTVNKTFARNTRTY